MIQTTCPSQDELLGFHLGTVSDQTLEEVADHLERCTSCLVRLQTLDQHTDVVLGVLRKPAAAEEDLSGQDSTRLAPPPAQPPLELFDPPQQPGELGRLGHYRLLRLIGRGGMGFVFEGEDVRLCRRAAVKVISPSSGPDADVRRRFAREARALAGIRAGEHVVAIYDVDENHRLPYLAMELLEGQSLDRWLAGRGPVPVADILRLGREAALGLAAAHEKGILHRDIKPSNLWVEADSGRVKVLDFGLARDQANDVRVTGTDVIAGTPAYMSPEQARGEPLDGRSDLFSLGCVLYELCAGQPPFRGKTPFAVMTALAACDPPPLRKLRPDLPPALARLVMELLDKDRARRPASARAVADRLAAIDRDRHAPQPPARWRAGLVLLAAALLLGAMAVTRVVTSKGTVEIEAEPGVKVVVERAGEFVTILDPVSKQRAELWAGEYHVKLSGGGESLKLTTDNFTLRRGEKVIVRVRRLPAVPKAAPADAWMLRVAKLGAEEQVKEVTARLRELNPDFKGKVEPLIESGVVRSLEFHTDDVRDISPVRALKGLRRLVCSGTLPKAGRLADLSPLAGMELGHLACHNTDVADLAPLNGMPLTRLHIHHTRVSDLSPLSGVPRLTLLVCRNLPIKTLAPLKGLKLTELYCEHTGVSDLSPLKGMELTHLNCGVTTVSDLSPLKGMELTFLGIGETRVSDLTPLKGMDLDTLYCNNTRVSDLSPLKGMKMRVLWANGSRVTDLAVMEGMPLNDVGFDVKPGVDLRPIRTLRDVVTINGKEREEFWREVEKKGKD